MKGAVAFVSRVALSEHLPAAAILIVQKSSRSKCRHNALPIQDTKNQTRRNPLSHKFTDWLFIDAGVNLC